MSSTCFEPEGSSSGRRLYVHLWYGTFYMHSTRLPTQMLVKHTITFVTFMVLIFKKLFPFEGLSAKVKPALPLSRDPKTA